LRIPSERFREVVFLVDQGIPSATGFFLAVPVGDVLVPYVVTARHCVEQAKGRRFQIRVNVEDRYDDIPTSADDWFKHDSADVAVIPWVGGSSPHYDVQVEILDNFISPEYDFPLSKLTFGPIPPGNQTLLFAGEVAAGKVMPRETIPVEVGHEVCFIGLLYEHAGMSRNLPIARFGHISRMPDEPIPLKQPDESVVSQLAYLVECDSWGGNSGSPCFWRHPFVQFVEVADPRPGHAGETILVQHEREIMALLGLVSGHLDLERTGKTEGDILGRVRMDLNSGIAAVTPAAAIRELLERQDVADDRDDRAAQMKTLPHPFTADVAPPSATVPPEFQRFEDLTRRLTRVSKEELDEERKADKEIPEVW
jgi:hypothetical protein